MDRLKRYLDQQKMSQTDLARLVGVSQPTVWGWINGEYLPSAESLRSLSKATGLSVDELLDQPARSRRTELRAS